MRFAIVGAGAVGGYYGARLARAGHEVTLLARGAHLAAMRERGLEVRAVDGTFTARLRVESDPRQVGPVDTVMLATKTYDNVTALPMVRTLVAGAPGALVLPLQNGVDTPAALADALGAAGPVLGGTTHLQTAVTAPGVITQSGPSQRITFGEVSGDTSRVSARVEALRAALAQAGLNVEAVPDARVALWDKLAFLAPFSGFTAASRSPIGPLWEHAPSRAAFGQGVEEVLAVARAEGVVPTVTRASAEAYTAGLLPLARSSLLHDLESGKPLEVEALQGAVVRRGVAHGVPTPVLATLYAVLRPHAAGRKPEGRAA